MDYDKIGKDVADYIINYNNTYNNSLMQVFRMYVGNKYKDVDEDKILVRAISYISKYGYDIVNTHPLIIRRYK